MSACPSPDRLRMLVCQSNSAGVPADLDAHVLICPACQELLSRWNSDGVQSAPRAQLADSAGLLPAVPGYEILEKLGRGGMGIVWKARHRQLGRVVALKMIRAGAHADAEERKRFHTEAQAIACLQHPHIVQIHEVGEAEGQPFCALEFVEGQSLDRRLATGPLAARAAAALLETLARAMHYAHEQEVIHRDLKPSNVLLAGAAEAPLEQCRPKITDFGLAKQLNREGNTQSGAVMGTPSFMAPEQAEGQSRTIGPRTDVYGLGAILYHTLTGRPPFRGTSVLDTLEQVRRQPPVALRRWQPKVPRDLETICLKCLEKEPAQRFGSAAELADDLRRFLDGEPILARPIGTLGRTWRWCLRRPVVASLLGALFVSALVSLALWWQAVGSERATRQHLQAAVEARQEATENFQGARQFLARYVELCQNAQLHGPATLMLRKALLEEALAYHRFLLQIRSTDVGLRVDQANLSTALSRLLSTQGRRNEAEPIAREAVDLWKKLLEDPSSSEAPEVGLAKAYVALGRAVQDRDGRQPEALACYDKAFTLWEDLTQRRPDLGQRWDRAEARAFYADLLAKLHPDQALPRLQTDQSWFEEALKAEAAPASHHLRSFLAGNLTHQGNLHDRAGRWDEAVASWDQAFTHNELVIQGLPGLPGFPLGHGKLYLQVAARHRLRGLTTEPHVTYAFHWFQQASQDLAQLLLQQPQLDTSLHDQLEAVYENMAEGVRKEVLSRRALLSFQRSVQLLEEVSNRHPENGDYLRLLLEAWCHLSDGWHRAEDATEAQAVARKAAAHLRRRLEEIYLNRQELARVVPYWHHVGFRLRQTGLPQEALELLEQGVEYLLRTIKADPHNEAWRLPLARTLFVMRGGQDMDAHFTQRKAVYERCLRRVAEVEATLQTKPLLVDILGKQAEQHLAATENGLAREVQQHALTINRHTTRDLQARAAELPDDDEYRRQFLNSCCVNGSFYLKLNAPDEAASILLAAHALAQDFFRQRPLQPDNGMTLDEILINLGKARLAQGRVDEGLNHWRQAIEVMREVVTQSPTPRRHEILRNDYLRLGRKLQELGRQEEADRWLAEHRALGAGQAERSRTTTGKAKDRTQP